MSPPAAIIGSALYLSDDTHPSDMAARAADVLGRKGLSTKDSATRLALCAVHWALGRSAGAPRPTGPPDPRTAVVVSSNLGNVGTVRDVAATVAAGRPRQVSPLQAPNASSNIVASSVALWFRCGGPNLMLCSGATGGLDAIAVAVRLLRARRADRVLVVGVEPADDDALALYAADRPDGRLRESAACVILADHDVRTYFPLAFLEPLAVAARQPSADIGADYDDCFGAAGVVGTALAVRRLVDGAVGPLIVTCGSDVDGWRSASITASFGRIA